MKGIGWPAVQKIPGKSLLQLYKARSNSAQELDLISPRKGGRACDLLWAGVGRGRDPRLGHNLSITMGVKAGLPAGKPL